MKKISTILVLLAASFISLAAADHVKNEAKCSSADNILGRYYIDDEDGKSYAVFFKHTDGTYRCQTVDGKPMYEDGKLVLDQYNPDPSLRNLPVHQAVIISGLKYNASEKQWDGGKIHHPLKKMLKADCTVDFVDDGKTIRIRGHVGPFGQSKYWTLVK